MAARSGGTHADHIADRRRRVAAFRLRGLTQREIVSALDQSGYRNPNTGKPYALMTINADLQAIREEWHEEAVQDISVHIAAVQAEIREVRRRAWAAQDLELVLKGLKQERDLLGLDAPKKIDWRIMVEEKARQFAAQWDLDESEVIAEAERILSAAQ